jgi:hypothetical protein
MDIDAAFGKADNKSLVFLSDLYKTFSSCSSIYYAEDGELDELKNYIIPESVVGFYNEFEPQNLPCLDGYVYLLSLDGIMRENSELAPSAYLIKYGLFTFATTVGGNVICIDLNVITDGEPRVVYVDKSWIRFDESERKVECSFDTRNVNGKDSWLSVDIINKCLPEIDKCFSGFLDKLSNSEYEDIEEFYENI